MSDSDETDQNRPLVDADEVELYRYTGKRQRSVNEPQATIRLADGTPYLSLNKATVEQTPMPAQGYVDYYYAAEAALIGLKPVANGDVTGGSYKLTNRSVSFGRLAQDLGLDVAKTYHCPAEWDADAELLLIDVSDVPLQRAPPDEEVSG